MSAKTNAEVVIDGKVYTLCGYEEPAVSSDKVVIGDVNNSNNKAEGNKNDPKWNITGQKCIYTSSSMNFFLKRGWKRAIIKEKSEAFHEKDRSVPAGHGHRRMVDELQAFQRPSQ